MIIKKTFVFVFKLYTDFYLYDVNTKIIICISKDLYELLVQTNSEENYLEIPYSLENEVNKLLKYDIFSEMNFDYEIKYHQSEYIEDILKNCMRTITLQVTQNCNLRCKYCVYSGSYENRIHSNRRMNLETAHSARGVLISTDGLKKDLNRDESFNIAYNYEMFKNFLWSCGKLNDIGSKLTIDYIEQLEQLIAKRTIGLEKNKKYAHPGGPCLIGVHKFFVNAEGYFYPCERVDESIECTRIGNIEEGFDIEKIKLLLNVGKLTEDECKKCWAFQFCTQCLRSAVDGDHLSKSKRLSRCNSSRFTAEQSLKDYIVLKECGSTFGKRIKGE